MKNEKSIGDSNENGMSAEDIAKLFDYPAVGELFSDSGERRLADFLAKLTGTRENLERIVRHGSREDAARADRAVRGINVTLDFLNELQSRRRAGQK